MAAVSCIRRLVQEGQKPRPHAVTFVQRFGGALNLNVHLHCLIPDGVFVRDDGGVRFVELAPPSDDEVMEVLRRVVARLERLLARGLRQGSTMRDRSMRSAPRRPKR